MRLRMNYWNGSLQSLNCHAPPKGARNGIRDMQKEEGTAAAIEGIRSMLYVAASR
jgi:hypothetical protein